MMAEVAAVVEWKTYNDTSNDVQLTCTITHTMKGAQTKAKTWSQDVSQTFQDTLTKLLASDKIETQQEAWQMFRERIESKQQKKFKNLTVDIEEVRFTGMPGDVTMAMSEMYGILNTIVE